MKLQIINIDSSKCDKLIVKNDVCIINLNSLIKRYNIDKNYISNQLSAVISVCNTVNFTNLASLCYRLQIEYSSEECYNLVKAIINNFKEVNSNIRFCQKYIHNQGEIDMLPFDSLYELDQNNNILYLNKILKDKLKVIGYIDSQIPVLIEQFKDPIKMMPKDLFSNVAFCTDENIHAYCKLKELLY